MLDRIEEGRATVLASRGKISKSMGVFYNPVMSFNRSITIVLLNSLQRKGLVIGLPLAATGIRGIRMLKEVKGKRLCISFNDISKEAVDIIRKNLAINKIEQGYEVHNEDASSFLLNSRGFDYVDIDPFGSPNPFLDAAIRRLARRGVLAVTATDTAPLAGTYPSACLRKYWSLPQRNGFMHETGLRILIRKVQLVASQYDKAMVPVFSYYKDHYYRCFFLCSKSKQAANALIEQHGWLAGCPRCFKRHTSTISPIRICSCGTGLSPAGPLWLGALWDQKLVKRMLKHATPDTRKFLEVIHSEAEINAVGFYSIGKLGGVFKPAQLPALQALIEKLKSAGFHASPTHFSPEGFVASGNPKLSEFL